MIELHVQIVGYCLIALALMHIIIPRYFNWKHELVPLSLITRQIFYVHTFFIAFTVLLMGMLCVAYSQELIHTRLGKPICVGLSGFWVTRLFFQFFVYSPKAWRGKKFETVVHILFSILWSYFSAVFLMAYVEEI